MTSRSKRMIAGAVVVGIGALLLSLLRPSRVPVETALVSRGPLRVTVDDEGTTRVRERFTITAPVAGRLERIEVREGATIAANQVVARIAPLPLDVQSRRLAEARLASAVALERESATRVAQTKAAADQAERAAARRRALLEIGGVSRESVEQYELEAGLRAEAAEAAVAAHDAARADVAAARAALVGADARALPLVAVRAPAGGRVLRVPDRSGRVVAAGAPLLEIGDARALEVVVPVLSSDAVKVLPGACAELLEWGGDRPLEGTVREVEPSAFTRVSALGIEEQRVNVVIDVTAPPPALGDNYRVEARIVVWEAEDVLLVPSSALGQEAGEWIAFVVRDGRAERRAVRIGERNGLEAQVLDGLAEGEEVVLFPSDLVRDGVRVDGRRR